MIQQRKQLATTSNTSEVRTVIVEGKDLIIGRDDTHIEFDYRDPIDRPEYNRDSNSYSYSYSYNKDVNFVRGRNAIEE